MRSGTIAAAAGLAAVACGSVAGVLKRGLVDGKDRSVFTDHANDYCRITDESGGREVQAACENLKLYVDAQDDHCAANDDRPFEPRFGYFPGESRPVHLCRDVTAPARSTQQKLRFLVFGDSGLGDDATIGARQSAVALAMARACPSRATTRGADAAADDSWRACDFAVLVGDAIYADGVADVFDPLLKSRFENIYQRHAPLPFYVVTGNHDYHGNVTAMVEYSWFSDLWRMPARHFAIPDLPPWVRMYAIDAQGFTGDEGANTHDEQRDALAEKFCGGDGWRLLFGHYPPQSNGKHGAHLAQQAATATLRAACPFDIFFAGHDHHQEHITTPLYDVAVQGGGGAPVRPVTTPVPAKDGIEQRFAKMAHGFAIVELTETTLDMRFYDIDIGEPSFTDAIYHCRAARGEAGGCRPVAQP